MMFHCEPESQKMCQREDNSYICKIMKHWKSGLFIKLPLTLIALSILWVVVLKFIPVYYTPLMFKRAYQFRDDEKFHTVKTWVPISKISPNVMKAAIASEDNRFLEHNGFDTTEMRKMYHDHMKKGKKIRGCSTISQQTAKNAFTFCGDSWWRKGWEAYYTFLIEKIWGKKRILEVYLNVAEMGKGIYGIEAAAKTYYNRTASKLSMSQSARIVACFPNPIKRKPTNVTRYLSMREGQIISLSGKLAYPDWIKHPEKK